MPEILFKFSFTAFGGPNEIQLYASSERNAEILFMIAKQELLRIEKKYSRYNPSSVISEINLCAGTGRPIQVDEETSALFDYAAACFETSKGLFDITSGVLSRAWDFRAKRVPSKEDLANLRKLVGWDKVKWHRPEIYLPTKGMQLDFGGFGKEYAVDKTAAVLAEREVKSALINLGGDLRVLGTHPDGSEWHVGISHPRVANGVLCSVKMKSGSLATSGDYERSFEIDGRRYSHIINPKTGWPVDGFQSVSIFEESCLIAGTAATITMLSGEKHGESYLYSLNQPFIAVRSTGEVYSIGIDP